MEAATSSGGGSCLAEQQQQQQCSHAGSFLQRGASSPLEQPSHRLCTVQAAEAASVR